MTADVPATAPLAGLVVVDLSTTVPGQQATQFLADAGADVIQVEPPGGVPTRSLAAWPALARGKRSVVLDARSEEDAAVLSGLIAHADVFVSTLGGPAAERLGLSPGRLAELNPRLVSASLTGFGSSGPWAGLKGYEGVAMAKYGLFHAKRMMKRRPGPAFVSVPFASWGATQTLLHAILAALFERESSGRGQHVEADLVRGMATTDTWAWFTELIGQRWPGAYEVTDAFSAAGEPQSALIYPLLIAPTKDGRWLQFAQVSPRLLMAQLKEFGLDGLLTDPKWKGFPALPTQELRTELWEIMIQKVGERTLAEWQHVFDTNPDVSAELFRSGAEALDHPQIRHDGRVTVADDPGLGPVRQPSTLVHADGKPLSPARPAPRLDQHGTEARSLAAAPVPVSAAGAAAIRLPLDGVTIVEFGMMFAAPFGSTLLTDLGARVIKIESLDGDGIRTILPFPGAGGMKVMQGKESIAVDLGSAEGKEIIDELVRRSDAVLQAFRAGAAERTGVDAATLKAINPDLVYVSAPGYGTGGPYGHRPAYAPSIGAAGGLALTDAPASADVPGSFADVKEAAMRLNAAMAIPNAQADGMAALAVASALLLGLLARARRRPAGELTTTMIASATHAMLDRVVDYPGRPASPVADDELHGYCALYRLYQASDGWVFLAAPADGEWADLAAALDGLTADSGLAADPRFSSARARHEHDADLAGVLAAVFLTRPAPEWESLLTGAGVGCAAVASAAPEVLLLTDPALAAEYSIPVVSPIFDEHPRHAPYVRFSRSLTQAKGSCALGEHTADLLREIGYDDEAIADLAKRGVIGLG